MKNNTLLKKFKLYAGIFVVLIGFAGCSDDDDNVSPGLPSGNIQVENYHYYLTGNILTVPEVIVGQNSWLAAVEVGEETTNNFIAEPVMVEKGTHTNVQLIFKEDAIDYLAGSQQVVLKLYADNQNGGTLGEWDISDKPIAYSNNVLILKTITIIADLTGFDPFVYFDTNKNGSLDEKEVKKTYWIGRIYSNTTFPSRVKFYTLMFHTTDTDYYDLGITGAEWEQGYSRMFSNWAQDKFSGYDVDRNGFLDFEEWGKIFNDSGWFESYDTNSDDLLSEEELNSGFFGDWDRNNDGMIDRDEFNKYRGFIGWLSDGYRPL